MNDLEDFTNPTDEKKKPAKSAVAPQLTVGFENEDSVRPGESVRWTSELTGTTYKFQMPSGIVSSGLYSQEVLPGQGLVMKIQEGYLGRIKPFISPKPDFDSMTLPEINEIWTAFLTFLLRMPVRK